MNKDSKKSELEIFVELFYKSAFETNDINSEITKLDHQQCVFKIEEFKGFSGIIERELILNFDLFDNEELNIKNVFDLNDFLKPRLELKQKYHSLVKDRSDLTRIANSFNHNNLRSESYVLESIVKSVDELIADLKEQLKAYDEKVTQISDYIEVN